MDALSRIFPTLTSSRFRGSLSLVILVVVSSMAGGCGGIAGGIAAGAAAGALTGSAIAPNPFDWPFEEKSRVLALDCAGRRVVLEFSEGRAWLFLPGETLQLHRIVSEPFQYGTGHWEPGNGLDSQVSGEPGNFIYDILVFVALDSAAKSESVILQEGEARVTCVVDRRETPFEAAKLGGRISGPWAMSRAGNW